MAKKRAVYFVSSQPDGCWKVTKQGQKKTLKSFTKKGPAIKLGRRLAKKGKLGQLKIKKRDGKIQTEYTYGEDPRRYPS